MCIYCDYCIPANSTGNVTTVHGWLRFVRSVSYISNTVVTAHPLIDMCVCNVYLSYKSLRTESRKYTNVKHIACDTQIHEYVASCAFTLTYVVYEYVYTVHLSGNNIHVIANNTKNQKIITMNSNTAR